MLTSKETKSLGRVLVTIDDLRALRDEISRLEATTSSRPLLEFNGGFFDEPEDMRLLTDVELGSLAVKGQSIEVHLSPTSTRAFGKAEACESIYTMWARPRQTRVRSRPIRLRDYVAMISMGILATFFLAGSVGVLFNFKDDPEILTMSPLDRYGTVVIGILFAVVFTAAAVIDLRSRDNSYAIIRAVTLDDYRKERATSARHWQVATISLAGACIALLGVVVALLKK